MMAYIDPEPQPKEDYDSWWVRREKQFEQRIQTLMLACRNAERARDEADAHRNRIEAELKAAKDCVSFNAYRAMEADLAAAREVLQEARDSMTTFSRRIDQILVKVPETSAPMTEQQMFEALMAATPEHPPTRLPIGWIEFARAIERHHGIGDDRTKPV